MDEISEKYVFEIQESLLAARVEVNTRVFLSWTDYMDFVLVNSGHSFFQLNIVAFRY